MFKRVSGQTNLPFKIVPAKLDIRAGDTKTISMAYTGSDDSVVES